VAGILAFWLTRSTPAPTKPPAAVVDHSAEEKAARFAELVGKAEALEAKGELAEALSVLSQAALLEPGSGKIGEMKTRLEGKVKKLAQWREAHQAAREDHRVATARNTLEAWRRALESSQAAARLASTEEHSQAARELVATATQYRDWAEAREEDKKGNLEAALRLADQALAAREPAPELVAFKALLVKKKRKKEFDRVASAARAEGNPRKALDHWKEAQPLADETPDVQEVAKRLEQLQVLVDPSYRETVYEAAMKRADAALQAGNLEEAEKGYQEAHVLKVAETKPSVGLIRVRSLKVQKEFDAVVAQAKLHEGKREWVQAIETYDRALKIKPDAASTAAHRRDLEEAHRPPKISLLVDSDRSVRMDFVLIKPGTFIMGDAREGYDQKPHEVQITRDFWMQTTEVTQDHWRAVLGPKNFAFSGRGDRPVESVNFDVVEEFLKKFNTQFRPDLRGRRATLPTEAEWEYACRAGNPTSWNYGDTESALDDYAWYVKNSGNETHPVATKKPNAWGLYDMHGNVSEWCADVYGPYSGKAQDPEGASTGQFRCVRGGNWNERAQKCRSAERDKASPASESLFVGFRLVLRSPDGAPK
jgi:formylglycine-generating enzyme required for sulfatase activity